MHAQRGWHPQKVTQFPPAGRISSVSWCRIMTKGYQMVRPSYQLSEKIGHIAAWKNKSCVLGQKGAAAAAAKLLQSCPTLCDPIDGLLPGSSVPGILQARTLEWVAISFSNAWKWKVKMKTPSRVWLFATPWTAAYQAPPSMGFSRQEYWSGLPLPTLSPRTSSFQVPRRALSAMLTRT